MASAADALRAEEVKRTRDVLRIGWLVAVGVAAAVLLSPGNPTIRNVLLVILALGIVGSAWMHAQLAQPQNYSPSRMNLLALAALACGQLGILYVGVFSAAPIMVALGLYFFCRTESKTSAVLTYVIAALRRPAPAHGAGPGAGDRAAGAAAGRALRGARRPRALGAAGLAAGAARGHPRHHHPRHP
jgi:hypothetical protein